MTTQVPDGLQATHQGRRVLLSDWYDGPYYLPGDFAPAGRYCEVDSRREISLAEPDVLPASCDGHVAVYVPSPKTWRELEMSPARS